MKRSVQQYSPKTHRVTVCDLLSSSSSSKKCIARRLKGKIMTRHQRMRCKNSGGASRYHEFEDRESSSFDASSVAAEDEGDECDDLKEYLFSMRQQQRRNTDFTQADNDLRRFLAQREQHRRDSSEMESTPRKLERARARPPNDFFVPRRQRPAEAARVQKVINQTSEA